MRKIWIVVAVAALLATGFGWYFGSPYWTLRQMRAAAVARDADTLAEYVDFPSVRDSLKQQINAEVMAQVQREQAANPNNPFMALGAAMAGGIVNTMVDGIVTKEGMRRMFLAGRVQGPEQQQGADSMPANWSVRRDSFDRFRVLTRGEDGKETALLFRRDGLGWRMVEVDIPDGGYGPAPGAPVNPE